MMMTNKPKRFEVEPGFYIIDSSGSALNGETLKSLADKVFQEVEETFKRRVIAVIKMDRNEMDGKDLSNLIMWVEDFVTEWEGRDDWNFTEGALYCLRESGNFDKIIEEVYDHITEACMCDDPHSYHKPPPREELEFAINRAIGSRVLRFLLRIFPDTIDSYKALVDGGLRLLDMGDE
jgi:hypothetical protein